MLSVSASALSMSSGATGAAGEQVWWVGGVKVRILKMFDILVGDEADCDEWNPEGVRRWHWMTVVCVSGGRCGGGGSGMKMGRLGDVGGWPPSSQDKEIKETNEPLETRTCFSFSCAFILKIFSF